jgi:hypothetical protein
MENLIKKMVLVMMTSVFVSVYLSCKNDAAQKQNSRQDGNEIPAENPTPSAIPDNPTGPGVNHDTSAATNQDNAYSGNKDGEGNRLSTGSATGNMPSTPSPNYKVVRVVVGAPKYKNKVIEDDLIVSDLSKVSFDNNTDMFLVVEGDDNATSMIHPIPFEHDITKSKPCDAINCQLAVTPWVSTSKYKMSLPDSLRAKLDRPGVIPLKERTKILQPGGILKEYKIAPKTGASVLEGSRGVPFKPQEGIQKAPSTIKRIQPNPVIKTEPALKKIRDSRAPTTRSIPRDSIRKSGRIKSGGG